jgi:hypothetical protein
MENKRTVILAVSSDVPAPAVFGSAEVTDFILSSVNPCIIKSIQCSFSVTSYGDNTGVIKSVSHTLILPSRFYQPDSIAGILGSQNGLNIPLDSGNEYPVNIPIPAGQRMEYFCKVNLTGVAVTDVEFECAIIINFEELE